MGLLFSKSERIIKENFEILQQHKPIIEEIYRLHPDDWTYDVLPVINNDCNFYQLFSNSYDFAQIALNHHNDSIIITYTYLNYQEIIIWNPTHHTFEAMTVGYDKVLSFFASKPKIT